MDFSGRRKKLQAMTKGNEFLITNPQDIYYYTGYEPSGLSFLMASKNEMKLAFFSIDNEAETVRGIEVEQIKKIADTRKMFCKKTVCIDEASLPVKLYMLLKKWNFRVLPSAKIIQMPRAVKEPGEIETIKSAIRLAKMAIADAEIYGKTEDHVKREIECELICRGGEKSFEPIVAAGYNSAFIHHKPSPKKTISKYEFALVDVGARKNGYCSDITRTFFPPFEKAKKMYDFVADTQKKLIRGIKPGVKVSTIQKLYEGLLKKKGYETMHSFGHGVGLSVQETIGERFKENMVLTVEPGVYIRGFGGCRIEDMVLVTKKGAKLIS